MSPIHRAEFVSYCREKLPLGGHALRNTIAAIASHASPSSEPTPVLLVADQSEEVLTLVENMEMRRLYIDSLLAAAQTDGAFPVYLVLALRADFYANCLDHHALSQCFETNLYNVSLMSHVQLREAIEKRLALAAARAEAQAATVPATPRVRRAIFADLSAQQIRQ
jgi:hypothetical protein